LCLSYTVAYAVYRGEEALVATVCPIPVVGSQFEFCRATNASEPPTPFNVAKVATAQDGLAVTASRVGRNHHLAWHMVDRQFSVRELRIRVGHSTLKQKEVLKDQMKSLIDRMGTAADNLSRFTASVGGAVDGMRVFDGYILRELAKQPSLPQPPSSPFGSPSRAIAAIRPLAALSAFEVLATENQVKALISALIRDTDKRISSLINRARQVVEEVEAVQEDLDSIRDTVGAEFGNLELNSSALGPLWVRLLRPGDMKYGLDGSHELLLNDMVAFYATASAVMRDTLAALVRAQSELAEFQNGSGDIKAILVEQPVELIADTLRDSIKRLDDSHEIFRAEWDAWRKENPDLRRGLPDANR
jgi:hypothetical protein